MDAERESELERLFAIYVDRLSGGEKLDPEIILAENPLLGGELLECLEQYLDAAAGGDTPALGTLGDYTLRCQIGRGGMGVVYDAWQSSMDRRVALKVLPMAVAADTRAVARFIQEAQLAGKLSHPNIVHVHGMGVEQQVPYYAMDYVEGETLAQIAARLREAPGDAATPFGKRGELSFYSNLASAFADVADGLQHAHMHKVIHRDIKPSNLILDRDGRLQILDFGLARLEGQESLTVSGDLVGTPQYMSPEQARRRKIPVDRRTDVYSLGATLYEMLAGAPPFRGKDAADTLSQIIEREPLELRRRDVRVPRDLETIVLKCLRKEPAERYGTAEALGQDLRRFVRGEAVEARPQGKLDRALRRLWARRLPLSLVGLGAASAALLLLLASVWSREATERRERRYEARVADSQRSLDLALAMKAQAAIQEKTTSPALEWSSPFTRELPEVRLEEVLDRAEGQLEEARALLPARPEAGRGLERAGKLRATEPSSAAAASDDALERGVERLLVGEHEPARIELAVARGRLPDSPAPVLLLAQSYCLSGQAEAAEAWLERCYQEAAAERREELALSIAEFWFTQRSTEQGLTKERKAERVEKWLARVPDSLRKRQAVFMAKAAADPANAVAAGEAALELAPEDPVTHCALAALYAWDLADFARAEEHARRALAAKPRDPGVLNTVSQVWWELGRYDEAVAAADAALAIRPSDSRSLFAKAMSGRAEESIDIFHKLLQRYPGDPAILGHLSAKLGGCGRVEEALEAALEGVRAAPGSAQAHLWLGHRYRAMERWQEAIEAYKRALEIDPANRYALWGYGRVCVQLREFDKALALLADAISRSAAVVEGNSAASRRDFCLLLRGLPKPTDLRPLDEFVARHEKARPEEHPIVLEGLALAYLHAPARQDLDKALAFAMRAIEASDCGSVGPQVTLASVRFARGETAEAVRIVETHIDPDPQGEHHTLLERCRDALRPDLVSFASVDALVAKGTDALESLSGALAAFEQLEPTPERRALGAYFRGRLHELSGRCEEAASAFETALANSGSSWSTAIPLVGPCIASSDRLREAAGSACRTAFAAPAPAGVLSRSLAALHALARPGEEAPGLEGRSIAWTLGPFRRETLFQQNLPFASFALHDMVLHRTRFLAWRPRLLSGLDVDLEQVFGSLEKTSAFVHFELEAPADVDALVLLEVDDEATFRLNDVEVHRLEGGGGPKSALFGARFHAGRNRILLEVRNHEGRWGASMRFTDATGAPLALRQSF